MAFDTDSQSAPILTADELWALDDIDEQTVFIPEWGRSVRIRALTLHQTASITKRATKRNPSTGVEDTDRELQAALMIVEGLIEPKLLATDVPKLKLKSAKALTRIVNAIANLGPTEDGMEDAAKSVPNGSVDGLSVFPGTRAEDDSKSVATRDERQ